MKCKIIDSIFLVIVVSIAVWTTNQCLRDNKATDILLANLEAVAQGEGTPGGKAGHIDNVRSCVIKKSYECVVGANVPSWVPYIGGMQCNMSYIDEVEFSGSYNDCSYTGNMNHSCTPYGCRMDY